VARRYSFKKIGWLLIVNTLDSQSNPVSGLEQNPVGSDLYVEFVDLIRNQGVAFGMGMKGLPGFGGFAANLSLRTP
jgi:hypothetical protein